MTEFIKKSGVAKHANAAYNGLSAAAIIWMMATFAKQSDFERHEDKAVVTHSKLWQQSMDNKVAITLLERKFAGLDSRGFFFAVGGEIGDSRGISITNLPGLLGGLDSTNQTAVVSQP